MHSLLLKLVRLRRQILRKKRNESGASATNETSTSHTTPLHRSATTDVFLKPLFDEQIINGAPVAV